MLYCWWQAERRVLETGQQLCTSQHPESAEKTLNWIVQLQLALKIRMKEKYEKYIEPPRLVSMDSSLTDQGNAAGGMVSLSSLGVQSD